MIKRKKRRKYPAALLVLIAAGLILADRALERAVRLPNITDTNRGYREFEEDNNFRDYEVYDDGVWNLTLVNRENKIPDEWDIELVTLPGGEQIDKRIYGPLMEMLRDAKHSNGGIDPVIRSGYRTDEEQAEIFEDKVARFREEGYTELQARKEAAKWVSKPGYSEHQLGLSADINGEFYDLYTWLQENSYKYGFIFRYPADKTDITGIDEEVWHYRYVGRAAAEEIYNQGICLEEYIENLN